MIELSCKSLTSVGSLHREWRTPRHCVTRLNGTFVRYIRNIVPFIKSKCVGHPEIEQGGSPQSATRPARPLRADAQRNVDALLQAARAVFVEAGVDAPMREIAKRADVGVGTVYRHFPQRSDLIAAVFRREIDTCAAAAPMLAAAYEPFDALAKWMECYVALVATKRGLAKALHSDEAAYKGFPAYRDQRLEPALRELLEAAMASGEIRTDIGPVELLDLVSNLCMSARPDNAARAERMVRILLDGLRYGARRQSAHDPRGSSACEGGGTVRHPS